MLWLQFSRRYMFSPKSHSVINIIAMVSVIAVAIPTAAMIILLAMFGGLSRTIESIYSMVDADIEIVASRGQTFPTDKIDYSQIDSVDGIVSYTPYLEQSVIAATEARRTTLMLRGVDSTYLHTLPLEQFVVRGSAHRIFQGDVILGVGAAATLGIPSIDYEVELYALNRKQISTLLPSSGISRKRCKLGGVISANAELDATTAIVDLHTAQQLLNYEGRISGVALRLDSKANVTSVEQQLQTLLGEEYNVRTRSEKSASMNALLRLERFVIILIGAFIAIVAAFAIVGSVVMLITDKQRDIATLRSMGATRSLISNIFVGEGFLLTLIGCIIGLVIGVGFSLGQQHYGWIKIPGNMVFESYPIELTVTDVVTVAAIILFTGWIISLLTVRSKLRSEKHI